ncbi:hypothetical protein O1611_g1757 [Lasiodiplodia mahajangana]|uniref:Uncharacterized protein n=1 Tax=Lasiodiplodia mahajangana TaxID=1108764 RepID=A0ACC2JWI8_9PEZI|nr:hypothetical protein O1611_g1757 [Lasiodiplodia mahajangana]
MPAIESTRAATRWTTRIVPVVLAVAVAYATYVVVARVCLRYLIRSLKERGAAIAILVLYFVFFLLMVATYARTLYNANFNPGVVPLGPLAVDRRRVSIPATPLYARPMAAQNGAPSAATGNKIESTTAARLVAFKFFVQFTTYTAIYCAVVLGATAYALRRQLEHGASPDPYLLATIVIAAFFGLFSFLMTVTSMRYIFLNMTNVDILTFHQKVYQLAVRVPRGTRSDRFGVIVYPLTKPKTGPSNRKREASSLNPKDHVAEVQADVLPATSRDDLATRTFAILETNPGENPWDLGPWQNWQSVMGTNPLDWVLPIRHSPCANHDSLESLYRMDRMLEQLRSRYGLSTGPPSDESTIIEMRGLRS